MGYITVPACKGSLAEAKEVPVTKPLMGVRKAGLQVQAKMDERQRQQKKTVCIKERFPKKHNNVPLGMKCRMWKRKDHIWRGGAKHDHHDASPYKVQGKMGEAAKHVSPPVKWPDPYFYGSNLFAQLRGNACLHQRFFFFFLHQHLHPSQGCPP
eukprot:1151169-Pelagomonas_calceolata.AAC.3